MIIRSLQVALFSWIGFGVSSGEFLDAVCLHCDPRPLGAIVIIIIIIIVVMVIIMVIVIVMIIVILIVIVVVI